MEFNDILEKMKCPICLEILEDKIFLCMNGHLLCEACSNGVTICPQCRVSVEGMKTRNLPLEELLDIFKFDCVYAALGCSEKIHRKDIKFHAIHCTFNGKHINICKQIGYPCEFLSNMLNLAAAQEHFQAEHNFITRDDFNFPIHMCDLGLIALVLQSKGTLPYNIWRPIILNLGQSSNSETPTRLLLLSLLHTLDKSVSWICIRLAGKNEGIPYHVEFKIESVSDKTAELSWRTPAFDVDQLEKMFSNSPLRVPMELLLRHYIQDEGHLIMNVKFYPMKGKRQELAFNDLPSILYPVYFDARKPSFIKNESTSPTPQNGSDEVIFDNIECRDCADWPIKDIRYLSLVGPKFSVCKNCVWKEPCYNVWFGIARTLEQENKISGLWSRKETELTVSLPGSSVNCFREICTTEGCSSSAIFACLQCNNVFLCRLCMRAQCNDHILAMFYTGRV